MSLFTILQTNIQKLPPLLPKTIFDIDILQISENQEEDMNVDNDKLSLAELGMSLMCKQDDLYQSNSFIPPEINAV